MITYLIACLIIGLLLVGMVCMFSLLKSHIDADDEVPTYDEKQGQRDLNEALATASQWQHEPFDNLQH